MNKIEVELDDAQYAELCEQAAAWSREGANPPVSPNETATIMLCTLLNGEDWSGTERSK